VTLFLILAALMVSLALGLVAWPLFRGQASEGRGTLIALAVLAIALPVCAALIYRATGNAQWSEPPTDAAGGQMKSVNEMVAQLEARLKRNPADVDGWLMLGRSQLVLSNAPRAVSAYAEAYKVSGGKNLEAVVGYGEALAIVDQETLKGRAGELFEEALKLDPQNPKALFYGGAAAAVGGRLPVARDRWAALLKQPLPDNIRTLLVERINEVDQQMGRKPDPELAKLAPAAPPMVAGAAPGAAAAPAGNGPAGITVKISISPALAGKVPAGTPLFVLARDPSQPGPPFAVKRLTGATLPLEVTLTEQDAMLPSRTIRTAQHLLIVARYSLQGTPTPSPGDVYGEAPVDPAHAAQPLAIAMDKQVP
jgi:cytochrome c-type biogenesis protein CcmH